MSGLPDIGALKAQIGNIRFAWFSEKDMRQRMNLERIRFHRTQCALGGSRGLSREEDLIPRRFANDLIRRSAQPLQLFCPSWPFQDDPLSGRRQRHAHEFQRIHIRSDQAPQKAHLFFDQGRLLARGVHGIDQNDVRKQGGQKSPGVSLHQLQARDHVSQIRACSRALHGLLQQRMHFRRALEKNHLASKGGEKKCIPAESRRSVDNPRRPPFAATNCLCQFVTAPLSKANPAYGRTDQKFGVELLQTIGVRHAAIPTL
jgi:hypothetical protein